VHVSLPYNWLIVLIIGTSYRSHYNKRLLKFMIFWNVTPNNFVDTPQMVQWNVLSCKRRQWVAPKHTYTFTTALAVTSHNSNLHIHSGEKSKSVYCFSHTAGHNAYMMNNDETNKCASVMQSACVAVRTLSCLSYTNPNISWRYWQSVGMTFLCFGGQRVQSVVRPLPGTELWDKWRQPFPDDLYLPQVWSPLYVLCPHFLTSSSSFGAKESFPVGGPNSEMDFYTVT
jgi:hypothetical protein